MSRLLRSFSATSAVTGIVLLIVGVLEQADGTGMTGFAPIGLGVVLIVAALVFVAPIPSARALRHEGHGVPATNPGQQSHV